MGRIKDIIGYKFGRLTVIKYSHNQNKARMYLCKCDCGNEKAVAGTALRQKVVKSCGCYRSEYVANKNYKHGKSRTPEYNAQKARMSNMKRKLKMPKWADKGKINEFYLNRPIGYEVDHIIPLNGKTVSGLHVETNLQYLKKEDNRAKSNTFNGA